TYENLKVISRDGSIVYKNAISLAHPKAIQVSDRFHLLKNLTEYCKTYLKTKFNVNVVIDEIKECSGKKAEENQIQYLTLEAKWKEVSKLIESGISKSLACKQFNLNIKTYNKLIKLSTEDLNDYFLNTLEKRQQIKREQKNLIINKARELNKEKYSLIKISEILGVDRRTVKKYIDPLYTPKYTRQGRLSILDQYKIEIKDMLSKGISMAAIYRVISGKGYKGSNSNLRHYCSKLKKEFNSNPKSFRNKIITIKRSILLRGLYKSLKSIPELDKKTIEIINKKYPFYIKIIELISKFKLLLKEKNVENLTNWIVEAKSLNNSYINSFINGIKRDIEAVKNSIKYEYNNGLAEGSINKLKVIKRIMYGRNSFEMLKNKVLYIEST
ncbi:transposase, partial [Tepidibacter sp. Z1-5]|uniref:transposase n=1 Tax=Tepidibacter sp. Z1-5 TaxID=3134138 RepID=UPI0030C345D3